MSNRTPSDLSRREALILSAAGAVGTVGHSWLPRLVGQAHAASSPTSRVKSCIVVWLTGGPSQYETFDMKPDAPAEIRGDFKPIQSSLTGVQVCEYLPKLAKVMDQFALVRTISTSKGPEQHTGAHNYIRFGRVVGKRDTVNRPCWGAIASAGRDHKPTGLPNFVVVGPPPNSDHNTLKPGYLRYSHAPMTVLDASTGLPNLAARFDPSSSADRLALLAEADREHAARTAATASRSHHGNVEAALNLMRSPAAAAFDLSKEPEKLRDAYGRYPVGQGCLLARRLVEVGVPFVEVTYPVKNANGDWDTHKNHFPMLKDTLLPTLDSALPTLIADLKDRGMLDSTLVIAMGEMGRTPKINSGASRDHFCVAFPALFAGGGVKVGQVIGATSKDGTEVKDRPVNAAELLTTVGTILGLDGTTEFDTTTGKPVKGDGLMVPALARTTLFDTKAKPVQELIG